MLEIDTEVALSRYIELTQIPGRSGDEKAVADRIIQHLVGVGVPRSDIFIDDANTKTDPVGNVGNLIVTLPGDGSLPRTMLSAHMDTVPICLGSDPKRVGDEITSANPESGLGADDRAGCAAILTAVQERYETAGKHPRAVIAFLIQEEIGLRGARHLDHSRLGRVDRAFNFDGGSPSKLVIGAIGGQRMTITVQGIPAHAGVAPQRGTSAIVIASSAIADLHGRGWLGLVQQEGQLGTANVGIINGGEGTNVITPLVTLRAEARSHSAEFRQRIVSEIQTAFENAAAKIVNDQGSGGRIDFSSTVDYESFRLADDHPSITAAMQQVRAVGREPFAEVSNGGLDANWLYRHGVEAVTLGCGQRNIHTADERLDIPEYLDACRIATALITAPSIGG